MTDDKHPGRFLRDNERTAFGLGWEHKRLGTHIPPKTISRTLWANREWLNEFMEGFDSFICSDKQVNEAMLNRGVKR